MSVLWLKDIHKDLAKTTNGMYGDEGVFLVFGRQNGGVPGRIRLMHF